MDRLELVKGSLSVNMGVWFVGDDGRVYRASEVESVGEGMVDVKLRDVGGRRWVFRVSLDKIALNGNELVKLVKELFEEVDDGMA